MLNTERVSLRYFKKSDIDDLVKICNDKEFNQYIPLPYPYYENDAKDWILAMPKRRKAGLEYDFAIIKKDDKKLIGSISLMINKIYPCAEIGYWIAKPFWGKGYATEATKKIIEFAFENLGLHKVYAKCYRENIASAKVIEKSGLVKVGILTEHALKNGKFHDCILFELINKK